MVLPVTDATSDEKPRASSDPVANWQTASRGKPGTWPGTPYAANYRSGVLTANTFPSRPVPDGSSATGFFTSNYRGRELEFGVRDGANGGGLFASAGAGAPDSDRGYLTGLRNTVDFDLYNQPGQTSGDPTGIIRPNTRYYINEYLAGRFGDANQPPEQRLASLMSVLGPSRTYAALFALTGDQVKQLGLQDSLNKLTASGQFTASDAQGLALAQANFATSESLYNKLDIGWIGSLMNSLPNDKNGMAVKAGYILGCTEGARQLSQQIASGKYSGQELKQLMATFNNHSQYATQLSANFPDSDKMQLFSQFRAAATQQTGPGAAAQADLLNAYAANLLGSLSDKSQVAATLRVMGGVGANGAIDPNSKTAQFLRSALNGQSQFGIASFFSNMTPYGEMPQGVTSLLNAVTASGDTKLMAGTLDTVMQWTIKNPAQAAALAAQDTGDSATGYRKALTGLLDKSFNQFVALNPADPNAKIARTMQPQTIAGLQALSAVVMGPPYNSDIAGDFAQVVGKHAVQFAAYAQNQAKYPELDALLKGSGNTRNAAAVIFGQLMNGFDSGLSQSQAAFTAQAKDTKYAADQQLLQARVVTDLLRGMGTGLLLASAWITGGGTTAIGLGAVANGEKLASIFGRVGLFSGSMGTFALDAFFGTADARAEQEAVDAVRKGMLTANMTPSQLLHQTYNGWFSNISQIPGAEGQMITDGVMTGSGFAGAPTVISEVQQFYTAYNPQDYYFGQTGKYPAVS